MYQYKSNYGVMFPFLRYQYFRGGYKTERNAPYARIDDYEIGLEWQMNSSAELTTVYTFADRTNTATRSQANTLSYGQFVGDVLRMQFQFNY
jgi:alpha-N-acetylglucosamine transferase